MLILLKLLIADHRSRARTRIEGESFRKSARRRSDLDASLSVGLELGRYPRSSNDLRSCADHRAHPAIEAGHRRRASFADYCSVIFSALDHILAAVQASPEARRRRRMLEGALTAIPHRIRTRLVRRLSVNLFVPKSGTPPAPGTGDRAERTRQAAARSVEDLSRLSMIDGGRYRWTIWIALGCYGRRGKAVSASARRPLLRIGRRTQTAEFTAAARVFSS